MNHSNDMRFTPMLFTFHTSFMLVYVFLLLLVISYVRLQWITQSITKFSFSYVFHVTIKFYMSHSIDGMNCGKSNKLKKENFIFILNIDIDLIYTNIIIDIDLEFIKRDEITDSIFWIVSLLILRRNGISFHVYLFIFFASLFVDSWHR